MAYKIKTGDTSHWYSRTGESVHQVPKKTSKTGEMRNTTIKDAKELKLVPSVTGVTSIPANEGLMKWKLGQVAFAATQIKRQDGEDDETYADRIVLESLTFTRGAADFGELMHATIEDYLLHAIEPIMEREHDECLEKVMEFWPPVKAWLDANIESVAASEYVIVNSSGYAGRVDLKVILKGEAYLAAMMNNENFDGKAILDFKTRNPTANGHLMGYEKELWQGAAYSAADPDTHDRGHLLPFCNLYIGSKEPGALRFQAYTADEMLTALEVFGLLLALWKLLKGYDPAF